MYIYQIMNNSFGYIDIILLGMIAGFIILRLRSILGRKTGHESKVYPSFAEEKFNVPKKEIKPVKQNLETLEGKDKKDFLKGAEIAYNPNNPYIHEKVIRGGSFLCNASYCASYRVTSRMATDPHTSLEHLGFRTVLSNLK